jgi:limonene-1,2-epoxide hydrolase
MDLTDWIERYRRAWEAADAGAIDELFTADASYRSSAFREAHVGRAEIAAYWRDATSTQSDVSVLMGRPFVDGARVAVEWWATMNDGEDEVTLPGCLLLEFAADGRCRALREYWQLEPGRRAPPPDWGR